MRNLIKQATGLTIKELVNKYKQRVIKNGSFVIKKSKYVTINGVRNSLDKKWFIDVIIDCNTSNQSCNYQHITIAKGKY